MVTDIRWVTNEEGTTAYCRKVYRPIIIDVQSQSICHTECRGIRAQHERRQRVRLDRDQFGPGENPAGSEQEATRPGAGINHTLRSAFRSRPSDHGFDNRRGGINRALVAADSRRSQSTEGIPKRVVAVRDCSDDLFDAIR